MWIVRINNKTCIFSAFVCLLAVSLSGYSESLEYAVKAPLASQSLLLDAVSVDDRLIAVGERGHILILDNGQSWRQAGVPTRSMLTAVYFHNKNLGWVVGHDAVILRTVDGGQSWERVFYSPEDEAPLLDVWFKDDLHGLAIGAYSLYLTTTDGGKNWVRDELNLKKEKLNNSPDNDIADNDFIESYDLHLNSIEQADNGKLYIVAEAGRIYRSADDGHSWIELPSPYVGSFFGIQALDNDTVLVYGLRGHLFRSEDAGINWEKIESHTTEMLTSSLRLQDGTILIVGLGGTFLESTDNGKNFSIQELGNRYGYAAIVQNSNDKLTTFGDHGIHNLSDTSYINLKQ